MTRAAVGEGQGVRNGLRPYSHPYLTRYLRRNGTRVGDTLEAGAYQRDEPRQFSAPLLSHRVHGLCIIRQIGTDRGQGRTGSACRA